MNHLHDAHVDDENHETNDHDGDDGGAGGRCRVDITWGSSNNDTPCHKQQK